MKSKLSGNKYIADLGPLKVELFFESGASMIFTILEGGSLAEKGYAEKVAVTVSEIRPDVYMVA